MMKSSSYCDTSMIISVLVLFSLLSSPIFSSKDFREENETSMEGNKLKNMKSINAHLRKINKPFVKSIKSPDGDIIDCVLFHLQPAFDLSELRGKMSLISPELPKGHDNVNGGYEIKQLWNSNGESCPNGTIPIRRTSARNIVSFSKFRKKYSSPGHEHAVGQTNGEFYGANAFLNVWKPNVTGQDFSLSQIWVMADYPNHINSLETGWQVYPSQYKDNLPRLFTYWTPNGYQSGCYYLECPGFVQTNEKFALGAAISPISTYNGRQYDVPFMIWKDPISSNWWLRVGIEVMGYWPATLFKALRGHATTIEYGGEVYSASSGRHTSTEMGSGHFQDGGLGKSAYARNLEVVDSHNNLNGVQILNLIAEKPNCYGVRKGFNVAWNTFIYFGGPGYNPNCH